MPPALKRRKLRQGESELNVGAVQKVNGKGHGRAGNVTKNPAEQDNEDSSSDDEPQIKGNRESYRTLLQSFGRNSGAKSGSVKSITGSKTEPNSRKSHFSRETGSTTNKWSQKEMREEHDNDVSNWVDEKESPENDVQEEATLEPEMVASDGNDEEEDSTDPFEVHFANLDEDELSRLIKDINGNQLRSDSILVDAIGEFKVTCPISASKTGIKISEKINNFDQIKLKKRLLEPSKQHLREFTALQAALATPIFNYHDLLCTVRTPQNAAELRSITSLHALNHIFKTRDRVIKNNNRLARDAEDVNQEFRDQGFTRPKILFLLETRQSCSKYMDTITSLCKPEQQENKKRFQDAFMRGENTFSDTKPEDFRELFEGNDDNEFRLGVKFTRKTIKYYSQFYNSDMILASPLGLRRAMKSKEPKKTDYDFLSSIEIVIVDQADAMLMQNWEHVEVIFEHLNLQPKESHNCDFSRLRKWYLDQQAKYLRQTIVFSAFRTPELNSLFASHMSNVAGKFKTQQVHKGVMIELGLYNRQTFSRFETKSPASDPDDRFKYFTSTVLPTLIRMPAPADGGLGILIFIPFYPDFVRLRNFFNDSNDTQNLSHGAISEYSEVSEMQRARSHFFTGKHSILLYSGRAHHFRRNLIRGVKKVIMYGLPENPVFYKEIAGDFLGATIDEGKVGPEEATLRAMFSKFDGLSLERIVGTKRVGRMLNKINGDTFDFQ